MGNEQNPIYRVNMNLLFLHRSVPPPYGNLVRSLKGEDCLGQDPVFLSGCWVALRPKSDLWLTDLGVRRVYFAESIPW